MPSTPEQVVLGIRANPVGWIKDTFGDELIGKQNDIIKAIADETVREIYAPSCHDSGKTFTSSRAAFQWLASYPNDSIVVSTAPTWSQVENLLWKEVAAGYAKSKVPFGGELLGTQLKLGPKWYAIGLSTNNPVNLQGFHATNILVIIDEADGVPADIWTALDGVLTSANAKLLAIGNPLDSGSEFKKRHDAALNSPTARVIRISADDVLPFSAHRFLLQPWWVEDKKRKWGETSALYLGKVLARWPDQGVDTLIPISWLMRAKDRAVERRERTLGVDVARFGTNRTVRTLMAGGWLEWSRATEKEDTMQTAGRVHQDIEQYGPIATAVDDSGVGGGVTDRLRQLGRRVRAVNNGESPDDQERFANKGSEMWWAARTAFEKDLIGFSMDDPEAIDELISDLNRPKYDTDARARIRVDKYGVGRGHTTNALSDEELAARSPDRGDSFVLAFAAAKPLLKPDHPKPRNLITDRSFNPADSQMRRAWLKNRASTDIDR